MIKKKINQLNYVENSFIPLNKINMILKFKLTYMETYCKSVIK